MNRRTFMKTVAAAGSATFLDPMSMLTGAARASQDYFGIHDFIEAHPEAVFIKRTGVSTKTDSEAKVWEGLEFAREIFTLRDTPGIPLSYKIAIKPNLTCVLWTGGTASTEERMGIITDCDFVEGMIEGMKEVGIPADNMYIREGNWLGDSYCPVDCSMSPYIGMAERTGIHLTDFPTGRSITELTLETLVEGSEVTWVDCPDGVMFKRIGYVAPFSQPDSWLLNVSKFKAHDLGGMTLCVKNLQGTCVNPHIHFCEGIGVTKNYPDEILLQYFQPDFEEHIEELYLQHLAARIPRWDRNMAERDRNSGYGLEVWAQRTCDSLSVINTGLNVIEGIYGRNGNAFLEGPGPGGQAEDFMTNVLIFGMDPFRVDMIGFWLSGHDPGNFGLFHIARERGLCSTINPMAIPVYLWNNGNPELVSLEDMERMPLVIFYLRQDYDGHNEPEYHLVNEPYCHEEEPVFMSIPLKTGWNLISMPIELVDNSIDTALSSIDGLYNCIMTYDSASAEWKRYIPGTPDFLRDLEIIEPGKGYWIEMSDSATLILYGSGIADGDLTLVKGCNLVGYNGTRRIPIGEALSDMDGDVSSVWTYDTLDGEWKTYSRNGEESLNSLKTMEPGKGYYIYT